MAGRLVEIAENCRKEEEKMGRAYFFVRNPITPLLLVLGFI
jgi:hypothetical protein